jgi:hypothetical protein
MVRAGFLAGAAVSETIGSFTGFTPESGAGAAGAGLGRTAVSDATK